MSRTEKIIIAALIVSLFAAVWVSYHKKVSRSQIEIISGMEEGAEEARGLIEYKRTVNINTADIDAIAGLPGIGPAIAQRIIEYRQRKRFSSGEELLKVKGIGPKKYQAIKGCIRVDE